ncbi:hypothetical protein EWH70_22565 [Amycolatopsis suaedae]|uniref:DUF4383 domain-containing protein n=1 Tax=Amycolatopsis suaedae TaxID=2510978 RepID=A0A4Q7J4F2_9PSEU|nr:hypothetical protein EWH70_22565 [Amycolatopsis suaedae]
MVLGFSVLSTGLHYAHNVFAIDQYPPVPGLSDLVAQILVAGAWVLLTAAGAVGYLRYTQRRYWAANAFLLVYSLSGLGSLGHFVIDVPNIPAFWFATIVTDALAAAAIWGFVMWTASMLGRAARLHPAAR